MPPHVSALTQPSPAFSILVPTMNQAAYISQALDSVLSQGVSSLEVIVMDGGSTDGTQDILRSYGDRIRWRSEPDRGQTHALNKGLGLARGRYIGWLNSDDIYLPGALKTVKSRCEMVGNPGWLIGRCIIIDDQGREIRKWITRWKNAWLRRWSYNKLLLENFVSQPAVFVRHDVLVDMGPFDESRLFDMDYDMWLRIGETEAPLVIDEDLAAFRVYETSITSSDFESSLRNANELSRKYSCRAGKPWIGALNYWLYYRRTALVYALMRRVRRLRAESTPTQVDRVVRP